MKCQADPAYFVDSYIVIDDAQGHGDDASGTMPFRLWNAQAGVLWKIDESKKVIILKARQLGLSWLCCAYELWRSLFQPGQLALLFSIGEEESKELLRRVRVMYERMPDWLRERCPLAKPPATADMEWQNGSRIKSLPSSSVKGSGFTASSVLVDEFAKIQVASDLYAALKPTIDGGGQMILVSTAFGIGNKFHSLWTKAETGESEFATIFLPWHARPGRDRAWYEAQLAEETDPSRVKENYPATPTEAFRVSGRPRFQSSWIEAQQANVWAAGLPVEALPEPLREVPNLTVYELPQPDRTYLIAADVAKGLEHGDYSDAVVIDADSWVEMAVLNGHWEPDEYARYLKALREVYGGLIAPERNNHGEAVISSLKLLDCWDIWQADDGQYGWNTNVKTKPQMIDILAEALRDNLATIRTQAALNELLIYKILPNGDTSAPAGEHDDRVMSRAIALAIARRPQDDHNLGAAVAVPLDPPRTASGRRMVDPAEEWNRTTPEHVAAAESGHPRHRDDQDPTRSVDFGMGVHRERRRFYGR